MEQIQKAELNRAAAELAVWGSTMPEPKKANEAKMASVAATVGTAGALLSSVSETLPLKRVRGSLKTTICAPSA
jgi:hypothetical protein